MKTEACPRRAISVTTSRPGLAVKCQLLASTFYWEKCKGVTSRIAKRYQGWYLRVADARLGRQGQVIFPAFAVRRPQDLSPVKAGGNAAVRTIGRVQPGRAIRKGC